jgi:hypothetical protein
VSIQDLGSIGEIVGAVATVATLLYLAVQIRHSARLLESSIVNSTRDAGNESSRVIGGNRDAARVYRLGLADRSGLDPDETQQFDALVWLAFTNYRQQFESGTGIDESISYFVSQPGALEWWGVHSPLFSEDLRSHIDQLLRDPPPAA